MVPMLINALPEYVDRNKVVEFFKSLGIDVHEVIELQVGYDSIRVSVYANNVDGKRYWDRRICPDKVAAINVIYIPFKDIIETDESVESVDES